MKEEKCGMSFKVSSSEIQPRGVFKMKKKSLKSLYCDNLYIIRKRKKRRFRMGGRVWGRRRTNGIRKEEEQVSFACGYTLRRRRKHSEN